MLFYIILFKCYLYDFKSIFWSSSNTTSFNEPQPQNNTQLANNNNISKVKYATAIKLAKDAIENIKLAGYEVALEELETPNDYQIIIKVQK